LHIVLSRRGTTSGEVSVVTSKSCETHVGDLYELKCKLVSCEE
jgi:hypothetical protein